MVAEPAGELPEIRKRRNEIEIGANLCLSYRFAPILYRYGLSTVYPFTTPFSFKMTIFDAPRQKVRTRKNLVK